MTRSEHAGAISSVLLIEDNDADADSVVEALGPRHANARVTRVVRLAEGLARLAADNIDVVVLDLSLPDSSGLGGLRRLRAAAPTVPVLVLTGSVDASLCAQALHDGAQDYLVKGELDGASMAQRIRDALERQRYLVKAALLAEEQSKRAAAEHAQRRATWLAEAGRVLSSSLDIATTMENLVRAVVPSFADACVVELADGHQADRRVAPIPDEQLRRLRSAMRTGQAAWHESRSPEVMVVPMAIGERVIGAIELSHSSSSGKRFDRGDCHLAEELGHRAALALENATLYQQARAAITLRDEFVSIASHELRTPLSTLQLQVQILQYKSRSDAITLAEVSERLEKCVAQTGRLSRLVDTLLDVSLVATGRIAINREELDLRALIQETIDRLRAESTVGAAALSFAEGAPVPGRWDRMRLEQVVTNLVTNGVKYGGGRPVEVTVRADGADAVLSVQDGGIGIAAADLRRIFGRFERAAPARNYSGLGLGLYVTRQIVEAHGGTITVESEPGSGSLFVVTLPLDGRAPAASADARQ